MSLHDLEVAGLPSVQKRFSADSGALNGRLSNGGLSPGDASPQYAITLGLTINYAVGPAISVSTRANLGVTRYPAALAAPFRPDFH